ncbi:MAG: hypothetical protein IJ400_06045 [Clostridia bacterium]|nr:hypothetical protein [Clostridia bacterium]
MNNYSNMSFDQSTKKSLFGYKAWARIAIITSMIADFVAFLYLILLTGSLGYAIIPLLLLLVSGVFVALSFVIDYRYAYSVWFTVGYILLQTVGVISLLYYTGVNVDVTMSTPAYIVHIITHLFAIACYGIVAYATNKIDKSKKRTGVAFVIIATLASVASILYTCIFGFFGQNIGLFDNEMVLVYEKNEDNTYEVKDILYGRGDTVVIPEAFDGKDVTSICAEVFSKRAIKKIVVENNKELKVENIEALSTELQNAPQIQVHLELMDYYREILFNASIELNSKSAMELCNQVTYISCPEDKAVVSFNYNFDNFPEMARKKPFPTIILDKGSIFSLENYISDVSYLSFVDADTEEEVLASYYQGVGYYLSSPMIDDNKYLDGVTVNSSIDVLPLSFGRVFLIEVTSGNDEKYEVPQELSTIVKDTDKGKLVKDNQISTYIASINNLVKREGFDVEYKVDGNALSNETLQESLTSKSNTTIVPNWTIHTPKITGIDGSKTYTYGDELLSLTINAESVHNLKYQLVGSDALIGNNNVFTKARPNPADSDTYTFRVYIDDEKTALTAEATQEISILVNKKKVEANWTIPENAIYNENAHSVSAIVSDSSMAFEDSSIVVTDIFDGTGEKVITPVNAGIYRMQVSFADEDLKQLYTIINATQELKIARCRVDAIWTNTSLIYTGKQNAPSVLVNGVSQALPTKIISDSINVGDYTAYVELVNDIDKLNYSINNISQDYTISPKVINAYWSNSTLQYNDTDQAPEITGFESNSLCENDTLDLTQIEYNGLERNVGAGYTVVVSENFQNYDISSSTSSCDFQITKAPLLVNVASKEVVYDGKIFDDVLDVKCDGLLGNDTLTSVIAQLYYGDSVANAQNVGDYVIELSAKSQGADFGNYEITYQQGQRVTIAQARANVKWGSGMLTYTSQEQHPSVSITGVSQNALELVLTGAMTNVGQDYKAEIALKNTLDIQNYYIAQEDLSLDYVINPRTLTITAEDKTKTYDSKVYTDFTYTYQGLGTNDTFEEVISKIEFGSVAKDAIDAGEYPIQMTATSGEKRANYDVVLINGKLVISKATASVTATNNSFVFDTTEKLPTIKIDGALLESGEYESVSFNAYAIQNNQRVTAINVGTYSVEIELTNDNYKIGSYNISLEITPATASAEWGETTLIYTGEKQLPTATVKGVGGVLVDFTLSTDDGLDAINVGDYVAKITLNDSNYVLDNYIKDFTITQKSITPAFKNTTLTYNDKAQLPSFVFMGAKGETVEYSVATKDGLDAINVGDYVAVVTLKNNNYKLDNNEIDFKIEQAELSVEWGNTTHTYNKESFAPSVTLKGVNDTVVESLVSGAEVNVGNNYTATVSIKNVIDQQNYCIKEDDKSISFEITPATASVEWGETTLTYTGEKQFPTATVKGVGGVSVDFTVSTVDGLDAINVGEYVAKITLNDSNYVLDSYTEEFKITVAQVSVSWDYSEPYTYNGASQKPSVTVTGINNNNVDVTVEYKEAGTEAITDSVNAGTYVAIITLNDTNYTIDQSDKELTYVINKKDLTITANNLTVDYTGNSFDERLTYDHEGLAQGEELSDVVEINLIGDAIGAIEVGSYTIELSKTVINDQNYNIILANGTLTINQVVSAPDQE